MTGSARASPPALPVDEVVDALRSALAGHGMAILVAPPGAGKTTRVPLALQDEPWLAGAAIRVIEPRRLAARAAARRMAATRGEEVGRTVGYRVRLDSKISERTRIEVVTDGVFRRQVLDDPELAGVGAVLFDEFHERSLDVDFGLALVRDVRAGLRPDLRVLIMSATIDAAALAGTLGGVPVIESRGRIHPVETRHVARPPERQLEDHAADVIIGTLRSEPGSVLCFLPGHREIRRTAERLTGRLPGDVDLHRLAGSLDRDLQDAAIEPPPPGRRKVVLSTAIAETSLTIEGVRIVVDCGLARVPRFDPGSQMTRLGTMRASLASVDQRRGRAGRTGPGLCLRLWHEGQTGALPAKPDPEIRQADLAGLVLDMAAWGVTRREGLPWVDPPPLEAWNEAVRLLQRLAALDGNGAVTVHGRTLGRLPLHPRLAHMILAAGERGLSVALAAEIAAVLSEPGLAGREVDLRDRLRALRVNRTEAARALRRQAADWAKSAAAPAGAQAAADDGQVGILLALAYPDRIARSRGRDGAFKLANGKGCVVDSESALAHEPFLAVAEIAGASANGRVLLAAPVAAAGITAHLAELTELRERHLFDDTRRTVVRETATFLGEIAMTRQTQRAEPGEETARLLLAAVRRSGFGILPFETGIDSLCRRLAFLRESGVEGVPEITPASLLAGLEVWLAPYLVTATGIADIGEQAFRHALSDVVPPEVTAKLARLAPVDCALPSGRRVAIDYARDGRPGISVIPHELFGSTEHPAILEGRYPLAVTLLSPAGRPVQVTRDLRSFWSGSWSEVRSEMKARYPKHHWPEDPVSARPAASSVKPR